VFGFRSYQSRVKLGALVDRVARWPVFHRPGQYFTANLAEAGKRPEF